MLNFKQYLMLNEQSHNPWARGTFDQSMIDFIMRGDYTTPRPPDLHPLDFDGDGVLGSGDILHILSMWGHPWHPPGQEPEGDDEGGGHRANGGGRRIDPRIAGIKNGVSPASAGPVTR